jgi:hypothetical protein
LLSVAAAATTAAVPHCIFSVLLLQRLQLLLYTLLVSYIVRYSPFLLLLLLLL